jgi:tRNA modification GTPase
MSNLPDLSETIVALATPPGTGAIAVVRLSGSRALPISASLFQGVNLTSCKSHTAHFGRLIDASGRIIDEVLITIFRGPRSYTGEDTAEISCHGSPFIQAEIIRLLISSGARMAQPGEFTLRAFLNGKMDLSQAEAVADLIATQNAAAHDVAMQQLRGGFKKEIDLLRTRLINFAALIELELDFSEEEVAFADRAALLALVTEIRAHLHNLLESFQWGNALKTGIPTVLAGRPNAGKSTLLNALLNDDRALVSEIPGTTRDTIEEILHIGGVPFRLTDTAGIRETNDHIEALGLEKTHRKINTATLLLYVWDVTSLTLADLYADLQTLGEAENRTLLIVCNKMDQNPYFRTEWITQPHLPDVHAYLIPEGPPKPPPCVLNPGNRIVPVSAKNEQNMSLLREQLLESVTLGKAHADHSTVSNGRHYDALLRADEALQDVASGLQNNTTADFIAQDIRRSLHYLGTISGEIGVEDLLETIFGKFCIGK